MALHPSDTHVAALVESIEDDNAVVTLVNLSAATRRELVVQAGAFGEHRFTTIRYQALAGGRSHDVFSGTTWQEEEHYDRDMAGEVEENEVAVGASTFRVAMEPCSKIRHPVLRSALGDRGVAVMKITRIKLYVVNVLESHWWWSDDVYGQPQHQRDEHGIAEVFTDAGLTGLTQIERSSWCQLLARCVRD